MTPTMAEATMASVVIVLVATVAVDVMLAEVLGGVSSGCVVVV